PRHAGGADPQGREHRVIAASPELARGDLVERELLDQIGAAGLLELVVVRLAARTDLEPRPPRDSTPPPVAAVPCASILVGRPGRCGRWSTRRAPARPRPTASLAHGARGVRRACTYDRAMQPPSGPRSSRRAPAASRSATSAVGIPRRR